MELSRATPAAPSSGSRLFPIIYINPPVLCNHNYFFISDPNLRFISALDPAPGYF
jgi:hypothetical protein